MTELFTPHTGLMVWTIVTFAVLVSILAKFGWKPLIQALDDRDAGIKRAIDDAQAARTTAEQLKAQFQKELAEGQEKARALLQEAVADAQKARERLIKEAEEEARRLTEANRRQLEEEKDKVMRGVRKEVAVLSVQVAEKLLRKSMNPQVQEDLVQSVFDELDKQKGKEPIQ